MKMRYGEDIIMKSTNFSRKIPEFVRLQRLRWAGHVVRIPDNRLPKSALNCRMQGKRPKGRPRKRWEDGNLEESGVRSTVLEGEDRGDQGSIWAVAPLEKENYFLETFTLNIAVRKTMFI